MIRSKIVMATNLDAEKINRINKDNFFIRAVVSNILFIDSVDWGFAASSIYLLVKSEDRNNGIEYSFDGQTVHGELIPTTPANNLIFTNRRESSIWFRKINALSPDIVVRVEVWRS